MGPILGSAGPFRQEICLKEAQLSMAIIFGNTTSSTWKLPFLVANLLVKCDHSVGDSWNLLEVVSRNGLLGEYVPNKYYVVRLQTGKARVT